MKNYSSLEEYIEKFPTSQKLYAEAVTKFPRGVTHDARFRLPFPIYVTHTKGGHKWDVDGHDIIDYWTGHTCLLLGAANPTLVEAVKGQIDKGTHYSACHELEMEWVDWIRKLTPSVEMVEFTSSGTEANMLGMRLARAFTGREKILKFHDHFHGWCDETIGLPEPSGQGQTAGLVRAFTDLTTTIPCNDAAALEEALSGRDVAVLIVETPGAHAGCDGIAPAFYTTMRELTREYGTLLMFDEIVSWARFSTGGAQVLHGGEPDLTSLGKVLGGGVGGVGAIGGSKEILELIDIRPDDPEWNRSKRIFHSGTFNGNPLCAAAGIATLKRLATGEPQKTADERAAGIREGCGKVLEDRGVDGCTYGECSSFHLYIGPCPIREECNKSVCLYHEKVYEHHLYTELHRNMLFNGVDLVGAPPLFGTTCEMHTEEDIEKTVAAFADSLDRMKAEGILK